MKRFQKHEQDHPMLKVNNGNGLEITSISNGNGLETSYVHDD